MCDVNLRAMQTIGRQLGIRVGYSDHTVGIEIPVAAVALGATVIEKHFTLSRSLKGPDHKASLEPKELKAMVPKGFSAAVYTQTTDVEGEVNGLMTYDRKVIKINEAEVRKANQEVIKALSE